MFAEITSANVVGYKAEALQEGFTMMTPCFVNVADAEAGMDLTALIAGGEYGSGDIMVQTLTADGLADKSYSFNKDRKGNWFWSDVDTGDKIAEGDVVFSKGTGLWVYGVVDASLTSAGAVSTSDAVVPLTEGFTACGNMMAVEIDLTSIIPGGEYGSGDIMVQTLTPAGLADKSYSFNKDRKGNWFWSDVDTGDKIAEGDVKFAPGAGLWVYGVDGATITIPGPTL